MMYQMYQAQCDALAPWRAWATAGKAVWGHPVTGRFGNVLSGTFGAASELLARSGLTHTRPPFGIDSVEVNGEPTPVMEEAVLTTPFATLLHFKKAGGTPQPRVLLVAPLSGHFATLLRDTARTMSAEHDVYVTDWHNARDVGLEHGRFGADEYIEHVIRFLERIGPGAHVVAVCQPCVPVLAAVAVMAQSGNVAQPRSMTLMAGPVDARCNPTKVNQLAERNALAWFERLIDRVPSRYAGAGRRVYPGFVQLAAFMNMNLDRHVRAHRQMFEALARNDFAAAGVTRAFYDEYFAVLDLPAEFFLETVQTIFREHAMARGKYEWRGRRVEPGAIAHTSLLTVEGEKDDICGLGQTLAAQELCTGLKPLRKRHHLAAGVGHYGVFNGSRWRTQVYPVLKNVILASD